MTRRASSGQEYHALPTFLKSAVPMHYQPSLAYYVASFLVGRLLRRLFGAIYPQGQAADAIIARQTSKPPGLTESLYTRQSFQAEFESVAPIGATLSHLDAGVVLKYLEREARVLSFQKNAVKFVKPPDAEAITQVDFGGLVWSEDDSVEARGPDFQNRTSNTRIGWGASPTREQKKPALTYLRSTKRLEELLVKMLSTQATRQPVLNESESAATEVEIMKRDDTYAWTLQPVLQNPLLQKESIEATVERMADVLPDNDLTAGSAGVPEADDDGLKDRCLLKNRRRKERRSKNA
ncbi:hypothetical protein FS837_000600 [Tulasnella sp. UAMH 9824]|nr:hypothetical protein FS837_000600 [Tulasnella sp. UAMH 9824]